MNKLMEELVKAGYSDKDQDIKQLLKRKNPFEIDLDEELRSQSAKKVKKSVKKVVVEEDSSDDNEFKLNDQIIRLDKIEDDQESKAQRD